MEISVQFLSLSSLLEKVTQDAFDPRDLPEISEEACKEIYEAAYAHYEQGKYLEASRLFRFLALMDNGNKYYWKGLGASYQMLKEFDKALEVYAFALLLDPSDPRLYLYTADCLFALDKIEEGLISLQAAKACATNLCPLETQEAFIAKIDLLHTIWSDKHRK